MKTLSDLSDLADAIHDHLSSQKPEAEPPATTVETSAEAATPHQAAASKGAPIYRDATLNKRNIPEYAGEDIPDEKLPDATASVVDNAIPQSDKLNNLRTKAKVEFALKRGDVAGAEAALDQGAKGNPNWQPQRPGIVPSVKNIRENNAMVDSAEAQPWRMSADSLDDRATQQEMNWDLEKHGYRAESEARREFIARNSTGITKGDLNQPDMLQQLKDSLAEAQARKSGGTAPQQ
jgi:hypothetical protein